MKAVVSGRSLARAATSGQVTASQTSHAASSPRTTRSRRRLRHGRGTSYDGAIDSSMDGEDNTTVLTAKLLLPGLNLLYTGSIQATSRLAAFLRRKTEGEIRR